MKLGTTIEAGIPHALFNIGFTPQPYTEDYAADDDGQRFLLLRPIVNKAAPPPPAPITVIPNWTNALKAGVGR